VLVVIAMLNIGFLNLLEGGFAFFMTSWRFGLPALILVYFDGGREMLAAFLLNRPTDPLPPPTIGGRGWVKRTMQVAYAGMALWIAGDQLRLHFHNMALFKHVAAIHGIYEVESFSYKGPPTQPAPDRWRLVSVNSHVRYVEIRTVRDSQLTYYNAGMTSSAIDSINEQSNKVGGTRGSIPLGLVGGSGQPPRGAFDFEWTGPEQLRVTFRFDSATVHADLKRIPASRYRLVDATSWRAWSK
jgi:hypothetical protein